jgi:hypothetical protein
MYNVKIFPQSVIKLMCEEKKGQNRKIKGFVTIRLFLSITLLQGMQLRQH